MTSNDTHSKLVGYILWIFGFTGSHRFYYGKPITGTIWFFTLGLVGIGWLIDLFLIPGMDRAADRKYQAGRLDYTVAWVLLTFSVCLVFTASTWEKSFPALFICSPAVCSCLVSCMTIGP